MSIFVVRHAKAGDPERWQSDDRLRPLTRRGQRQAEALGELLQDARLTRILSSPYRRCLETVAPLAGHHGITVQESPALAVGRDLAGMLALIAAAANGTVLCSHGDMILALLEHLTVAGILQPTDVRSAKGSTWVLDQVDCHIFHARYLPPPG